MIRAGTGGWRRLLASRDARHLGGIAILPARMRQPSFRVYSGTPDFGWHHAAYGCMRRNRGEVICAGQRPCGLVGWVPPAGFEPALTAPEADPV